MNQSTDNRGIHHTTANHSPNQQLINCTDSQNAPVRRMRTLKGLAAHYRCLDVDTAISEHYLRTEILAGNIPFKWAGNKRLICIEDSDAFLNSANTMAVPEPQHEQISRVE